MCKKKQNENLENKFLKMIWTDKKYNWITTNLVLKNDSLFFSNTENEYYCINIDNSKLNFKFKTNYNPFHKSIINNNKIFFSDYGGDLNCVNFKGEVIWQIAGNTNIQKDLSFSKNYLYGSIDNFGFSKIDEKNGDLIWSVSNNSTNSFNNSPVFYKGNVFLGINESFSKILAIKEDSGKILWKTDFNKNFFLNQFITKEGLLVLLNRNFTDGKVVLLNYEDGKELWSKKINCDQFYNPVILDNSVVFSTHNNTVVSADIKTGKTIWELNLSKENVGTDLIKFKDKIYFGTVERNLYSIYGESGKINFKQSFFYGLGTPMVENNKIYFPTGGSEMWVLK